MTLRLVAAPDGAVTAVDRALWLTLPFSLPWTVYVPPDNRAWLAVSDCAAAAIALSEHYVTTIALSEYYVTTLTVRDEGDT